MRISNLVVALLIVGGATAYAQGQIEYDESPTSYSLIRERLQKPFSLAAGMMSYNYEEPGLMKISGQMIRLDLDYRLHLTSQRTPMWIGAQAGFGFSTSMTYDGALQDLDTGEKTPMKSGSKDQFNDIRALYGASISDSPVTNIALYGGLGR